MGYFASASLTYGYDITKAASDINWYDLAWDCCEPGEHIGEVLRAYSPECTIAGYHEEKDGRLYLVGVWCSADQTDTKHEIELPADLKQVNEKLLWAVRTLKLDIGDQQPTWRLRTKFS